MKNEVGAVCLGVNDSLLATSCDNSIDFFDIRSIPTFTDDGKLKKLGNYADIHTDTITQLRFSSRNEHILASGAEDGLIGLFDTAAAAGEDAVVSIFNTECPIRRIGFFGNDDEGIYSLSTVETASFWHCSSAQRVGHFPNIREEMNVDYLVDCFYESNSETLCLLAGDNNGGGKLAIVQPTSLQVCGHLQNGVGSHTATIRCAKLLKSNSSSSRLITGGEDARLCWWHISPNTSPSGSLAPTQLVDSAMGLNTNQSSVSIESVDMNGKKLVLDRKHAHSGPRHVGGGSKERVDRRHKPY